MAKVLKLIFYKSAKSKRILTINIKINYLGMF
jgi:hypothetical protein